MIFTRRQNDSTHVVIIDETNEISSTFDLLLNIYIIVSYRRV